MNYNNHGVIILINNNDIKVKGAFLVLGASFGTQLPPQNTDGYHNGRVKTRTVCMHKLAQFNYK